MFGSSRLIPALILIVGCQLAIIPGAMSHPTNEDKLLHLIAYLDPPYMMLENGQPKGLVIDIAAQLFKRTKTQYQLSFMPPKRSLQTASDSFNHCVLAIERSQERETQYQWVSPLVISRHALYRRKDSPIRLHSLAQAQDFHIGSFLGSGAGEYLESLGFSIDYVVENSLNELKLNVGRIDLWATDTISFNWRDRNTETNAVMEREFLTVLRSMACHTQVPGDTIALLQAELLKMHKDGSVQAIYQNYVPDISQWLLL